jgi:hypothetical protein
VNDFSVYEYEQRLFYVLKDESEDEEMNSEDLSDEYFE